MSFENGFCTLKKIEKVKKARKSEVLKKLYIKAKSWEALLFSILHQKS